MFCESCLTKTAKLLAPRQNARLSTRRRNISLETKHDLDSAAKENDLRPSGFAFFLSFLSRVKVLSEVASGHLASPASPSRFDESRAGNEMSEEEKFVNRKSHNKKSSFHNATPRSTQSNFARARRQFNKCVELTGELRGQEEAYTNYIMPFVFFFAAREALISFLIPFLELARCATRVKTAIF